jgi:group I intron endonuclease
MIHVIYLTTCLINGVQYVGRHKVSNTVTLDPNYIGSGTLLKRAIKKHGKENFKRKIICKIETDDVSKVRKLEKIYIKKFGTLFPHGYNWIEGDILEDNPMDYKINKIKVGLATKKRLSDPRNNPMYGKQHSEETKKLMSISKIGERNVWFGKTGKEFPLFGKSFSYEHKRKISEAMKGHSVTQATKNKISESCKGKVSPMKGKKLSMEARRKISEHHADFSGSNNPMYGSRFIWINNGESNKRLLINSDIPKGWFKGMIFKNKIVK